MTNLTENSMCDTGRLERLIEQKFKTIEAKQDGQTDLINQKFRENEANHMTMEEQVRKTNGRVTDLERWSWFIKGGLVLLGIIVGLIGIKLTISF